MGYFANRAAPLGPVGPEVVHALFYNFGWERVARALPAAWDFAPAAAALSARVEGSVAALRRTLGDLADRPDITRAAELATRAAAAAPLERGGRSSPPTTRYPCPRRRSTAVARRDVAA